uniref:BZIP domain-containing protein n=1 Tax=Fusarium oxysporum (strain Fo5176) TaxID=660025 RepID=A0A0D2XRV8_FUSOF
MAPSLDNYTTRIGQEGCTIPTVGNAKSRRRLKNRESQRRFRERKDQLQKALQQQLDHSRTEYEALLCKYTESTTEAALLLQENDSLWSEIKDLRRHRQLMLSVMKSLQNSKPLCSLIFMVLVYGYGNEGFWPHHFTRWRKKGPESPLKEIERHHIRCRHDVERARRNVSSSSEARRW